MKSHFKFTSLLVLFAIILAACAPAATPAPTAAPTMAPAATMAPEPTAVPPTATPEPMTIVDIAAADGNFTTLVAALQATGLDTTLAGTGPFTVFAPTDAAFAKLPAGTIDTLLKPENKDQLIQILTYHVVAGKVAAADVVELASAETVAMLPIMIKVDMGKVMIDNATVTTADIMASNGVIHVIDTVLLPMDIVDTAVADGRFTTLATALTSAGLVETLKGAGPFTVFAPTDDAFGKLPAGTLDTLVKPENKQALTDILTYHVAASKMMAADVVKETLLDTVNGIPVKITVDGDKVMINDAQVIITDIKAANGVIHVIDSVLIPPKDIVDTAVADGRFTTLATALTEAGLVDTLKGAGPFTVFAPTDEAFAKLPAGTLDTLLKPENKKTLTDILTYHVASGRIMAADVVKETLIDTVNGIPVKVMVDGSKVMINDAEVMITDILTSNGVIHVIDSVLIPPKDIVDTAVADGRFTTLATALTEAGLIETLKGEGPFTVFAPTDDAFAKIPAATLNALIADKAQLTAVLTYHVVSGRVMAADVVKLTSATTVNGKDVTIKVDSGKVYVNDAQVIITDILTSNGVIHVIDTVLLP